MIAAASVFALILPVLMNASAFKNGPVDHGHSIWRHHARTATSLKENLKSAPIPSASHFLISQSTTKSSIRTLTTTMTISGGMAT
jgi:hypothetical protein